MTGPVKTRKQREAFFTMAAREGWDSKEATSPYLATSHTDAAWRIGRWLRTTGRTYPRGVRPARGRLWHCNEMLVRVAWTTGGDCTIARET